MSRATDVTPLPPVVIQRQEIFPTDARPEPFLAITEWDQPITYFVGRNGSGKSRAAKLVAQKIGDIDARFLSTDRLFALSGMQSWGWVGRPEIESYKGVPISNDPNTRNIRTEVKRSGMAVEDIYALRESPDVAIEVTAFIRRVFNRTVDIREMGGHIDPYVQIGSTEYSLFRDEGHGLRELVVLLAAIYRQDWKLLVVDEPELHLHPAAVRVWRSELERICKQTGRRAVIVTHEPALIQPTSSAGLSSTFFFTATRGPVSIRESILPEQESRVDASLKRNRRIVSQLVFAPQPVLVEGIHDVAALVTALTEVGPSTAVDQTEFINCGGSGDVALWFEISQKLGIDVRAVADLDALFTQECPRAMDAVPAVAAIYRDEFGAYPATTKTVIASISTRMGVEIKGEKNPAAKRTWLSNLAGEDGHVKLRTRLLQVWRDHGLWLHELGRLEDVLQISEKASEETASEAAKRLGSLNACAKWCAYQIDTNVDAFLLLEARVETIAHRIMESVKVSGENSIARPIGPNAEADSKMVSVEPLGNGKFRIEVKLPERFKGYAVEFDRSTPSDAIRLTRATSGANDNSDEAASST